MRNIRIGILLVLSVIGALLIVPPPQFLDAQANITIAQVPRTYHAGFSVVCGGSGDCVTIATAAAGVTNIREIWVSQPSTTATISVIRRSALDTGGVSSTITLVKSDTQDAAPNSIVTAYTTAPTPGTTVGTAFTVSLGTSNTLVRDTSTPNYKPFVVQSTTQCIAINVSTAVTITVDLVITEQ